jgi:hypothetical protein
VSEHTGGVARRVILLVNLTLALVTAGVLVVALTGAGLPGGGSKASAAGKGVSTTPQTTAGCIPPPCATTIPVPTTPATTAPPTTVPRPTTTVSVAPTTVPVTFPLVTGPSTTVSTTSTTSTTIAGLGHLPISPATLPLRTKGTNGHVDPVFAYLSGIGFFLTLVIMATKFVTTRPSRSAGGKAPSDDPS